jgi:preprotein translocase subunit SecG
MRGFFLAIHIIAAFFLIIVILLQQTKGGGLASVFGGGGGSMFGGRGAAPFLTKTTVILGVIFVVTSLSLTFMSARRATLESAVEKAMKKGEVIPTSPTETTEEQPSPVEQIPPGD